MRKQPGMPGCFGRSRGTRLATTWSRIQTTYLVVYVNRGYTRPDQSACFDPCCGQEPGSFASPRFTSSGVMVIFAGLVASITEAQLGFRADATMRVGSRDKGSQR